MGWNAPFPSPAMLAGVPRLAAGTPVPVLGSSRRRGVCNCCAVCETKVKEQAKEGKERDKCGCWGYVLLSQFLNGKSFGQESYQGRESCESEQG